VYSSSQGCHTATGTHMPYGITQCYLPPGRGDVPALTPAKAGTRLSDPGGMQGWVDLVCVRRHNLSCCYRSIPSTRVLGEINNVDQTYWLCYDSTCHFLIFNCRIHDQVRADSLICRNAVTWRSSLSNDERVTVDRATYNGTYNQKGHCVKVIKCERQFSLHCK